MRRVKHIQLLRLRFLSGYVLRTHPTYQSVYITAKRHITMNCTPSIQSKALWVF